MSSNLILFNKPFRVMSQFSPEGDKTTLAQFIDVADFYPAGRLDFDSEGLLLLTNHGPLQHIVASPDFKMAKTYWVQVEGAITQEAIEQLQEGVTLKDGLTKPAIAECIEEPDFAPRVPPVRYRESIPTSWISLQIKEGKNRQVRRMTAAVGFPTLRLIRYAIGPYTLDNIPVGQWQYTDLSPTLAKEVEQFEQRRNKTTSPNGRGRYQKGRQVPHGKRVAGRTAGTKPARRTHRKP